MSLAVDISHARRSASPNNSGRSTPLSAKLRSKDDENLTRTDKPYKRYASNVERALSSFDSALQEWADYISFLGRLLKALQTKPPNTTTIPFKTIVAKRLSQCVNPRLPAGVHQKTLDVYSYVFKTLGNDGLSKDLSLYLPGLAPTLSFAALSVKPSLLKLFEAYILPLGPKPLRPALKAVILALLPGLEEDSSEEFDRTLGLFATLKRAMAVEESGGLNALDSSGDQYFWQCFFLASITNPSRRSGALAYLTRSLPKLGSASPIILDPEKMNGDPVEADKLNDPATEAVTSPEPGLLIRCFCAGLQDQQLLIQRGFLDLLVTHLPLHSLVLRQKVDSQDVQKLVAAAASVVARREMSLNRRLWSWFLGPDPAVDTESAPSPGLFSPSTDYVVTPSRDRAALQADYFRRFGLDPLVRSITMMIDDTSSQTQDKLRPLRICLSLMDRWEIGALVVPRLFLPAMRSVWLYSRNSTSPDSIAEVVRSASVFFDGVESGLIWSEIYGLISQALPMTGYTKTRSEESIDLTIFMVFNFNIREEEMLIIHIPLLSLILLLGLRTLISIQNIHENDSTFEPALRLVSRLVDMIPERAFEPDPTLHGARVGPSQMEEQEILSRIEEFYMKNHGSLDVEDQPVSAQDLAQLLLLNTTSLVAQELRSIVHTRHLDVTIGILENLIRKIPLSTTPNLANMTSSLMYVVENSADGGAGVPFPIVAAAGSTIAAFRSSSKSVEWLDDHSLRLWIASLVKSLWSFLSPAQPKYHVEAVRSLWRLHSAAPDRHLVESSVTTLVLANPSDAGAGRVTPEGARRFATLWMHSPSTAMAAQDRRSSLTRMPAESLVATKQSTHELSVLERPLLLVLDTLNDEKSNSFVFVVGWLQSLPNIHLIADVLICVLQAGTHFPPSDQIKAERDHGEAIGIDDPQILIYYLELMSNLIRYATNNVWPALARITIFESDSTDSESNSLYLAKLCLRLLSYRDMVASRPAEYPSKIHLAAVTLLQQLLQGPSQASLIDLSFDALLLDELTAAVHRGDTLLQVALMDLTVEAFAIRLTKEEQDQTPIRPQINRRESSKNSPRISISADRIDTKARPSSISIPSELLDCLKLGLTDPKSRPIIEDWIDFLDHCLPLYGEGLFQILLSLVDCLCTTSESILSLMQNTFKNNGNQLVGSLEPTLSSLLGGLEQTLARSHDRLISGEVNMTPVKTPEQPQGFFGNMVSGVFTSDPQKTRSLKANNRLTVLLCFKDAVLICYKVWSWGTSGSTVAPCDATASASFTYNAVRLRNRARRIFEHLFTAEPLECLETLIDIWNGGGKAKEVKESLGIFNLLHVLEGSRPKNTIPALFNAMYSRTNPNALDPLRKSTLTSNLSDFTLAAFLVEYVNSLDDDAMDEIWGDCAIFLRDVLANPLPHRQTLPMLLDFTASLGQKVDNTNFGEQRRMRRDLGDLFVRLLTAIFTTQSISASQEASTPINAQRPKLDEVKGIRPVDGRKLTEIYNTVTVLASFMPRLSKILIEADRITSVTTMVSTNVIAPAFRSKAFPENVTPTLLSLLRALCSIPEASKSWKKDVGEALNNSKFFASPSALVETDWLSILEQWIITDKERMPELVSRLSVPASAGIVFGVGASSARLEADRKTQLNLRRIAILILAAANDTFVASLGGIQEKLVELLTATASSSPSSLTRCELYMVIRALTLKVSAIHMTSFWPAINSELHDAIDSLSPISRSNTYNKFSVLHACKLLDVLLILAPDEFQLHEWLFITDTIDAVYQPAEWVPVALVDDVSEELDNTAGSLNQTTTPFVTGAHPGKRRPLLNRDVVKSVDPEQVLDKLLRPFLRQLSIHTFESTYSMEAPDWQACFDDLIQDIFDDSTLV